MNFRITETRRIKRKKKFSDDSLTDNIITDFKVNTYLVTFVDQLKSELLKKKKKK